MYISSLLSDISDNIFADFFLMWSRLWVTASNHALAVAGHSMNLQPEQKYSKPTCRHVFSSAKTVAPVFTPLFLLTPELLSVKKSKN